MPHHVNISRFLKYLFPLLLFLNLSLLAIYLAFDYQFFFHSDSAVKNLLAQEIVETGEYFPSSWNYVNGDLWVFYTQTFIIPLLHFMRNGYAAHLISDLISASLTLAGTWCVSGVLTQSPAARWIGILVISSGMSYVMAENVYGQAAYGSMYYMACFLITSYWSLLHAAGRMRHVWACTAALLTILVFWANPQRAMVYYGLPLAAAALTFWWSGRQHADAAASLRGSHVLLFIAAAIVGIAAHLQTMHHVHNNVGVTLLRWVSFEHMASNLQLTVNGIFTLFDGVPWDDTPVASPFGAYLALRLLAAVALLFLLPWALLKTLGQQHRSRLFVGAFTAVSLILNLMIIVCTSLTANAPAAAMSRYLTPSILLMLALFAGVIVDLPRLSPLRRAIGAATIALLVTSAPTSFLFYIGRHWPQESHGLMMETPGAHLADFLEAQGLQYGYATFWNAGRITVLSSQQVRVRQIDIDSHGLPLPVRALSSNRWYEADAWPGQSFLLLSDKELPALNRQLLFSHTGPPLRELDYESWHVLVFADNIAAHLNEWSIAMRVPEQYPVAPDTPHQIGTIAGTPPALEADTGSAGILAFGPFRSLDHGHYTANFDIDTSGAGVNDFGFVDVVSHGGQKIHARQAITNAGRQRVQVKFGTDTSVDSFEFRAYSNGKGKYVLHGVEIARDPKT
jgi:hypothetical protein